jgi:hypothetical protein
LVFIKRSLSSDFKLLLSFCHFKICLRLHNYALSSFHPDQSPQQCCKLPLMVGLLSVWWVVWLLVQRPSAISHEFSGFVFAAISIVK